METSNPPVFHFEEGTHKYYLNDELLPGVTTILGTLNKPALVQWAATEAIKYIEANGEKEGDLIRVNSEILEAARTAHAKKRDKAADQGTDVHAEIETIIKTLISGKALREGDGELPGFSSQAQKFFKWATDNNVVFHESEKKMYSVEHKFAGTADFVATIDGKKFVGDIKTTSGIYDLSPFLQCAGYRIMLEEMGDTGYAGSVIIRLGKNGDFEEHYRMDEIGEDKDTFIALLRVYKAMARFKKAK